MNELLKLPLLELVTQANKVRKQFLGERLELCGIINAKSGRCSEDCKFCAQSSKHNCQVDTYELKTQKEIVREAKKSKENGAEKFGIVTSGNRPNQDELNIIAKAIGEIKETLNMSVCASLGALSKQQLKDLKGAGLSRYHHNIETSEKFYSQIVSTHNFKERVNTIEAAKALGLEVCSGGIIGLGEDWQDRIDMANILKELGVDSVPINLLVPMPGTPLESVKALSCEDAIRTICIFRIILKNKIIKIAAGRESILKDFQSLGFIAGANGMLIGGYLTIKGRSVKEDHKFIEEIKKIWAE